MPHKDRPWLSSDDLMRQRLQSRYSGASRGNSFRQRKHGHVTGYSRLRAPILVDPLVYSDDAGSDVLVDMLAEVSQPIQVILVHAR